MGRSLCSEKSATVVGVGCNKNLCSDPAPHNSLQRGSRCLNLNLTFAAPTLAKLWQAGRANPHLEI